MVLSISDIREQELPEIGIIGQSVMPGQYASLKIAAFRAAFALWLLQAPAAYGQTAAAAGEDGAESADGEERARKHFARGVEFFKAEDYNAALAEFLESYDINPLWGVKYNIAVCYMKLKKYARSLAFYREYLEEGGGSVPEERKAKVLEDMAWLEETVARVTFCCGLEGAGLVVDDVETFVLKEGEPVELDPGVHKIEVVRQKSKLFITQVTLYAGEETTLEVPGPPAKGGKKTGAERKLGGSMISLIAGLSGAALLAVAAVTTGALVLTTRDRMEDEAYKCESTLEREDCPDAYRYFDRARDLRLASNILTAAAVVSAGVGLTLFFVLQKKEKAGNAKTRVSGGFAPAGGGGASVLLTVGF
jgi:tetratricopeptide (TPR) repeat protein